jgi:hypothetical protein
MVDMVRWIEHRKSFANFLLVIKFWFVKKFFWKPNDYGEVNAQKLKS